MSSRSVVLVLCAVLAAPALSWAEEKPVLSFDVQITPGKSAAQHNVELRTYLNERLIDKHTWIQDQDCSEGDVISSLPQDLAALSKVDLAARVAEEMLALDTLPLDAMAEGLDRFELYADGRLVRTTEFTDPKDDEDPKEPNPGNEPNGCTATTTVVGPICASQPPVTSTHSFTVPCELGQDPCNKPIWGTMACTVTVTVTTTVCTTTTTTVWTPTVPGAICPDPVTIPRSTTTTTRQTGAPTCGPCQ